jgi:hypothetical protein
VKYRLQSIDDNHQLICAMRGDTGATVLFANLIYRIHSLFLAALLRCSR